MKVEEFERYLTEEELEMFKERLDPVEPCKDYPLFIQESRTFRDAICTAFNWPDKESEMWYKISQRTKQKR